MSHYLAQSFSNSALEAPSSPAASSSKVTLEDMEDELVWLGGLHSPAHNPHHQADDSHVPEVWRREDWDCPTDILYHHADHEDAGYVGEQPEARAIQQHHEDAPVDRPPQSPHPMHIDRPYNASALRAVKEAYDPSTWDSPTDILYSHAEHDLLHGSALGLEVDKELTPATPLDLSDFAALPSKVKRNAFGVEREPYNAETWDSPTDILYAHQSDGEDYDVKVGSDSDSSAGIASPYTPYSALLPTPRDSQVHLPGMSHEDPGQVGKSKAIQGDDAVLRAAVARM